MWARKFKFVILIQLEATIPEKGHKIVETKISVNKIWSVVLSKEFFQNSFKAVYLARVDGSLFQHRILYVSTEGAGI